ncbi:Bax inhibitor-1 family protein [Desulforamulus ruminis]|uniref:Uncharacterized protein n=1 Tax=Desulforamulus ruminis (strain ATCC 23193 / DSM 2154 / NCIMB 8452 / DL) TaxID=696281 RepID=F6DSL5_DESRL|nr:Bax inhibitor-1 family protein [Desulforamulus ruminis]AEG61105.1 hypothetical protein Desru_2891 [Desulforamulus ruminis DSM 2154]
MRLSASVYERTGDDTLSASMYNFVIGACLLLGFAVTAFTAFTFADLQLTILHYVGYLVSSIAGIIISSKSKSAVVSFLGYMMVVVPFGVILGPALNPLAPGLIHQAAVITGAITGTMLIFSTAFPSFFAGLGRVLLIGLIGLVVANVITWVMGIHPTILSWISAVLFSLYIGYDWYRAQNIPFTMDNAVDVCVSLYLDIINLFLSILRILSDD